MKQYSLPYWIKHAIQSNSKPEETIAAGIEAFAKDPTTCPFTFSGTPIEALNAAYVEWRKRCGCVHFNLFPTPLNVADELAAFANVGTNDIVFDPGCGLGNLMHAAKKRGAAAYGVEFQHWIPPIGGFLGLEIHRGDYIDGFKPAEFTCILTNPPFGAQFTITDATTAFLNKIADQATPTTKIAAILPTGFMNSSKPKARKATIDRFSILNSRQLGAGVFKPLTNIATEMVLLQKN